MDKENILITIFTPTYNRGYTIENVYKSLLKQRERNFEWLIIDDGSTDNTKEIVEELIKKNEVNLRYLYKSNQGKYKAINDAIEIAKGELFMIVDSDDYLEENAIEIIKKYYNEIKDNNEFIGVVGLRGNEYGEIYTAYLNEKKCKNKYYDLKYLDADFIDYRYKYEISGDRAEVCKTKELKKFKFPEISDEKFMGEGYLWNMIAEANYKFRYFNEIIYVTEYLEDGLSYNIKKIVQKSPINEMTCCNQITGIKRIPLKNRIKASINYYRYGMYAGISLKKLIMESKSKKLGIFTILIAKIFAIKNEGKK